jgi:uncharacterized protein
MKFLVKDVTSQGLEIKQTIPKEGIGLSDEEIDLRSPITIKAKLEKVDHHIVAHTHVKADYGYLCARCLEEFHEVQELEYDFDFEFSSELDSFDLGEEIRQEMILANPARILCKDDCKGICSGCGANLNVEKCKCK